MASTDSSKAPRSKRGKKQPVNGGQQEPRAAKPNPNAKSGLGRLEDDMLFVFSHPLRVRMLVSLNEEGDGSSSDLSGRLGVSTETLAHHMKVLRKYNFVELVDQKKVGSAVKSIYRALRRVEFPKEVWEKFPPFIQNQILTGLFLTSFADAELALLDGAYEKRPESHASWTRQQVDERAWRRLVKLFDRTFEKALEICAEADERSRAEGRDGDELLTVSLNMFSFVLPDDGDKAKLKAFRQHLPEDVPDT
ncbi:MAG TPA: winged helix-turn-helix domain-containing protein [Solirubrobacterales bacterium]|nr:winged helix-turn-helix domain-containing protein [Solirubrobacterales bacterium]